MTDVISDPSPVPGADSMAVGDTRGPPVPAAFTMARNSTLSSAGRCIPAGLRGEPVAGDFFDVFPLDDSRLLIALGDVAGHGLGAGARMTELRDDTRGFALLKLQLVEVLQRLDLMQVSRDIDDIATLWLGVYYPETGRLEYASAGHPPPILAGGVDGPQLLAEASAPPLGTGVVGPHAVTDEVELPVGGLLVAYSDGLVERPDRDLEDQIELLRAAVERAYDPTPPHPSLEELLDTILDDLVANPATARDDICLLMLRREAAVAEGSVHKIAGGSVHKQVGELERVLRDAGTDRAGAGLGRGAGLVRAERPERQSREVVGMGKADHAAGVGRGEVLR